VQMVEEEEEETAAFSVHKTPASVVSLGISSTLSFLPCYLYAADTYTSLLLPACRLLHLKK